MDLDHPSRAELTALFWRGLSLEEAGGEMERHLRQQREQAVRGLQALEAGRRPRNLDHLAHMWALLGRSWLLRHHDPQEMVQRAWAAATVSLRLDRGFYGPAQVCDFQAQAHAELGNSLRVADRLQDARRSMAQARRLFEQGTGHPLLEARLLELEASLLSYLGEFVQATWRLLKVLEFYEREGDRHLQGRTLVLMGLYTGNAGDFELAVRRLEQSLKLIDAERDPVLACFAAYNLILFLVDSGRIQEAKKLRLVHSGHLRNSPGGISDIKFRLLEGRIAAGEGYYQRAEAIFLKVIHDLDELDLPHVGGIERLDLAAVLLQQGKALEAEATICEAAAAFVRLGVRREALEAVILLRETFKLRRATVAMILEVAAFLRRLDADPASSFEARAWEPPEE
jgi:tetratricopeptide (TPR) repeat protein